MIGATKVTSILFCDWKTQSLLLSNHKRHTGWHRHFDGLAGGGEAAGGGVDAEYDDGVGILVGGEEEVTGGIDGEHARGFSQCGLMLDEGELTSRVVDGEGRDAVIAAVGTVEEFAVGVDGDFGAGVGVGETIWKTGNGLEFGEAAAIYVVVEAGDCRCHFVDDVHAVAVRREGKVTCARAGFDRCRGRIIGCECGGGGVEPVHEKFVQAEVSAECPAIGGIEPDAVGVRALLVPGMGTAVQNNLILDKRRLFFGPFSLV